MELPWPFNEALLHFSPIIPTASYNLALRLKDLGELDAGHGKPGIVQLTGFRTLVEARLLPAV